MADIPGAIGGKGLLGLLLVKESQISQHHVQGIHAVSLAQQKMVPVPLAKIFRRNIHNLIVEHGQNVDHAEVAAHMAGL